MSEYMPVPRCDGCRWWWRDGGEAGTGVCVANYQSARYVGHEWPDGRAVKMWTDCGEMTIRTDADFGCVQWESK